MSENVIGLPGNAHPLGERAVAGTAAEVIVVGDAFEACASTGEDTQAGVKGSLAAGGGRHGSAAAYRAVPDSR